AHDALAVHRDIISGDFDVGLEGTGELHQRRRGAGMQSQWIDHSRIASRHPTLQAQIAARLNVSNAKRTAGNRDPNRQAPSSPKSITPSASRTSGSGIGS